MADRSFNSALQTLGDNIDARLTLASLLLEDAKAEEAISLLTPPMSLGKFSLIILPLC